MPTETIIRTLKESKVDNPKRILPRTVVKAVADEDGNFISSDVTAQDINNLHGKTFVTAEQQTLTDEQKAQARQNIGAYAKPSDGIPKTDLDAGVNASLDRANSAALPDGYYGDSGGVYQYSTNFLGKYSPQNASNINFRPTASNFSGSGWSADSISGQTATIEKIKGKTLVFNQINENGNMASVSKYSLGGSQSGGSLSANNNILTVTLGTSTNIILTKGVETFKKGHKYLISIDIKPSANTKSRFSYNGYTLTVFEKSITANVWNVFAGIVSCSEETNVALLYFDANAVMGGGTCQFKNYCIFDLTQMYGAGKEPTTVEEFKAQFPLDYYAYNTGELISLNATGLKTVGFNQLYPDGHIDVLAGLTYKIEGTYTSLKDSAGNDVTVTNGEFTPIANDTYTMVGGTCVHLKWSGVRDGDTEEHWDSTLSLPIATYFADGMKSAGAVYDELTKAKAVKRIGTYTFTGNERWSQSSLNEHYFFTQLPIQTKQYEQAYDSYNVCVNGYVAGSWANEDKTISMYASSPNSMLLRVRNDSMSLNDIGGEMEGKTLYYELKEPVETTINPPLNLTYRCDDFGTEMLLPQNTDEPVTAPMDADIVYQLDYEADVRNMDFNMISKSSMDNFISAFNASGLGTITQTWDATNKKYNYTVTASQPVNQGGETV